MFYSNHKAWTKRSTHASRFACYPRNRPLPVRNNLGERRAYYEPFPRPHAKRIFSVPLRGPETTSLGPSHKRNLLFMYLRTACSAAIDIIPRGMPFLRLIKRLLACREDSEKFAVAGGWQLRAPLLVHLMVMVGIVGY